MTPPTDALFGPAMLSDPYPAYRRLRETDPVHWHEPFDAWVLTRYADVVAALHDPRFSSERTGAMQQMGGGKGLKSFFDFLATRMIYADPPRHTRLRGLVSKAFTPHAVEAMRPHIQALVDQFLDGVKSRGRMDVVADLAYPLPVTVIVEMLGVPVADRDRLKRWSDEFVVYFTKPLTQVTKEEYDGVVRAVAAEEDYFRAAVARLRGDSGPSLLGAMARAEEGGDRLTEQELYGNANLLLTAGHETTMNLIGNGTLALLRHPDQLEKLRADPSLLPGAIEEFLRFDAPVQFTHRLAKEDVKVGDKVIRRGQFVYLVLGAANRDPARFPDPDRLDITRKDNHHVAFGQGPHFCLGAPLARLEALIAFGTLLRRLPGLRLATDRLEYRQMFNLRGLQALPVMF
jgi:pimeloyl-[acyl-carrier protein] synthase